MSSLTDLDKSKPTGTLEGMNSSNAWMTDAPETRAEDSFLSEALLIVRRLHASRPGEWRSLRKEFSSPEELSDILLAQLPRRSPWDAAVGPFYTTEQLMRLYKVSRQAISDRLRRHTLLGLRTSDGQVLYPVFQFRGREVINGLSKILSVVADAADDWTLASWLVVNQPTLEMSVIEALEKYGPTDELIALAHRAVDRWSR